MSIKEMEAKLKKLCVTVDLAEQKFDDARASLMVATTHLTNVKNHFRDFKKMCQKGKQ